MMFVLALGCGEFGVIGKSTIWFRFRNFGFRVSGFVLG